MSTDMKTGTRTQAAASFTEVGKQKRLGCNEYDLPPLRLHMYRSTATTITRTVQSVKDITNP